MQPNGAGGRYRVCWSEHHQRRVRQLRERARQLGREADFLTAVRHIADRLEAEPLSWGDPSYQLHQLGLAVRHGIYAMLHVYTPSIRNINSSASRTSTACPARASS